MDEHRLGIPVDPTPRPFPQRLLPAQALRFRHCQPGKDVRTVVGQLLVHHEECACNPMAIDQARRMVSTGEPF